MHSLVDPARVLDEAISVLNTPDASFPLDDVDRALKIAPHDYRLWHVKGLFHREQEHRELAIPALKRAVELAPNEPLVAHGYARTLLEAGLPSLEAFGRAVKLAPSNTDVTKGLVAALIAEERIGDAIEGLQSVLRRSPLWVDGQAQLASLLWAEGHRDSFTRTIEEALAQHPAAIDLWRQQIVALVHAEQWDKALSRIADGRAALGQHPLFAVNEAIVYAESGNSEVAEALFAPFEQSDDAFLQIRRVRHYLRSDRPQRAAEIIDPWLERAEAFMFYPYASIAWRMTDAARWEWLEGGESFVGIYDISDRLPPLDQLAETLRGLHTVSGQPLEQSLRGGTQTDGNLFQRIDPVLVVLREAIRTTVSGHVASFPPAEDRHPLLSARREAVRFAGSWSVRLKTAGYHANHVHPMGWISSALYVALPPDMGRGEAGFLTLGEPRSSCFDLDMAPLRTIEPKPGRLVLFPSYMWHGTRPFGEGERLTVAFDVARMNSPASPAGAQHSGTA